MKNQKRHKKMLAVILVIAMCVTAFGLPVLPDSLVTVKANEQEGDIWVENEDGSGYWYHELEENKIIITSYTAPETEASTKEELEQLPKVDITIPDNLDGKQVVEIGRRAFSGAYGYVEVCVKKIIIPEGVTTIDGLAFSNCSNLKELVIPESVTSLGEEFIEKSAIERITIPKGVENIDERAFRSVPLMQIDVDEENPFYVSEDGVLYDYDKTTLVCYPEGKSGSFEIPSSVTSVGNYAFSNCKKLTNIRIPEKVTQIGNYAFSYCEGLTAITIPGNVKNIGENAFVYCHKLEEVTLEEGIETIGDYAFDSCYLIPELTIPASVTSIGTFVVYFCNCLTAVNVDTENVNYSSKDGVLYDKTGKTLLLYPEGKEDASYTIPATIETIEDFVFDGNEYLENIEVEEGNKEFASQEGILYNKDKTILLRCAEGKCKQEIAITIPDSVIKIDYLAFSIRNTQVRVTLKCFSGSEAEQYAKKHNIRFESNREAYEYTITFDANGGVCQGTTSLTGLEGKQIADMDFSLPVAIRDGYDFLGWYTEKRGGEELTDGARFNGNLTVYAQWEKNLSDEETTESEKPSQPGKPENSQQVDNPKTEVPKVKKPGKPEIKRLENKKGKKITVTLKKKVSKATGYQVAYSTKSSMKGQKIKSFKGTTITIKGLKKKKTYYFRVRAYTKKNGTIVYGNWGKKKSKKVKK